MNTINRAKRLTKFSIFVHETPKQIFTLDKQSGQFSYQNKSNIFFGNKNSFNHVPVRPFFGTKSKVDLKLYEVLEIDQSSSQEEIKKQFFKLAK